MRTMTGRFTRPGPLLLLVILTALVAGACGGELPAAGTSAADEPVATDATAAASLSTETAPISTDVESAVGTISGPPVNQEDWFQAQDAHPFPYLSSEPGPDNGWTPVDDVAAAEKNASVAHLDVPQLGAPSAVYSEVYPDGTVALLYTFKETPIGTADVLRSRPPLPDPIINDTWCNAEFDCQQFAVSNTTTAAFGRQSEGIRVLMVEQPGVLRSTLYAAQSDKFSVDLARELAASL